VVTVAFTAVFSHGHILDGKVVVIDLDNSNYSHEFIDTLNASPYIKVIETINTPVDPQRLLVHDHCLAVLYLPAGFEKNRHNLAVNNIGIIYDNINEAQTGHLKEAINIIVAVENAKIGLPQIQALGVSSEQAEAILGNISLKERLLFNPTNSHSNGEVMGFLFFFSSMFFVFSTIGIVPRLRLQQKWESQIRDGNAFGLMLRLLPYILCLTGAIVLGLVVLRIVGDLSFKGNYLALLASLLLLGLSLGLMSLLFGWSAADPGSAVGRNIWFVPPGFILGGFTNPMDILPDWVQVLSNVFPLVWEYRLIRDIVLRGASFTEITREFGGFMVFTGILAVLVAVRFHKERKLLAAVRQDAGI
jgi:ABC-2 type transport system permease protein